MAVAKSKSSTTARRREVRKNLQRPGPRWLTSLRRREVLWAIAFITLLTAVAGPVALWLGGATHHYPGQVLTQPITARIAFTREDVEATEREREKASSLQPPIYTPDMDYLNELKSRLNDLLGLTEFDTAAAAPAEFRDRFNLSELTLRELKNYVKDKQPTPQWQADTHRFIQELFDLAVLDPNDVKPNNEPIGANAIAIIHPDPLPGKPNEQRLFGGRILSINDTKLLQEHVEYATRYFVGKHLQDTIVTMVMQDPRPTYKYDPGLTELRRKEAAAAVPKQILTYDADAVLFKTQTELTRDDLALIQAEQRAYEKSLTNGDKALAAIGVIGLIMLIGVAIWAYIFFCNAKIVKNPMRGLAITTLIILCQCLAVGLGTAYPNVLTPFATLPVLMAATILVIVYDQRFALGVGGFVGLLILLSMALQAHHLLVMMAGVGVTVGLLHEVRSRSKLVTVGLWAGLTMAVVAFLLGIGFKPLNVPNEIWQIAKQAIAMIFTGLVAVGIVQWCLPAIEKVFKVTTAMTLKELNDASHPLLQRLAQEAPGTYQHSLRIADMAEAAADTIGADGLFCRVGAMYHDIGKINKPMYFIENQGGGPNRHDKLTPAMSLLIIVGHVKDGIEMAREYGLPPTLRHFIESHHGTTLVEYFYHAARKKTSEAAQPEPSEFEFRYPGPKPQTKEAAIMLLCDGIEGAARALPEPTPVRLEQVVSTMARKRLMDGQFDECNLTLSELHRIEKSIVKTLCAVYHGRIAYPSANKDQTAASSAHAAG